jgi:hypothetical protein
MTQGAAAMITRQATCSCGQLQVTTCGEPIRISVCHCLACQQRTGSIFGVQARFPKASCSVVGNATAYTRTADSGNTTTFHFCPTCGATVYYQPDDMLDILMVPVGAFADPGFPAPRISIYEERRHTWAALPVEIEHLA